MGLKFEVAVGKSGNVFTPHLYALVFVRRFLCLLGKFLSQESLCIRTKSKLTPRKIRIKFKLIWHLKEAPNLLLFRAPFWSTGGEVGKETYKTEMDLNVFLWRHTWNFPELLLSF